MPLEQKYIVKRVDGRDGPGEKHEHCRYFVLDLHHDVHSIPALKAYLASCRDSHPDLADSLRELLYGANPSSV